MTGGVSNQLKPFHLLYASQTGQSKALAEEITELAPLHGLKAITFCLSLIDKKFSIEEVSCAVFIVSTTGDGRPPDTAVKFFRRINRSTLKSTHLVKLNYALLALGDSNYIRFCHFGRSLESRLETLSAKPFYATGYGDDAVGLENSAQPWIHRLWPALREQLGLTSAVMNGVYESLPITDSSLRISDTMDCLTLNDLPSLLESCDIGKLRFPKFPPPSLLLSYGDESEKQPFVPSASAVLSFQESPLTPVRLNSARKLTSGEDVKTTLELEFHFEDARIPFVPGDSFGFICINPLDEVDILLERLNVRDYAELPAILQIPEAVASKRKLPAHIPPYISLRDVFLHCVEIRSVPKKILLRVLAEFATEEEDKAALLYLSSQEGAKAYTDCIRKPSLSLLDILLHYKSCTPPIERLLEYLPCLKPRFYSVASSPLENEASFRIVFNVLKMDARGGRLRDREGVCTGWLGRLAKEFFTGSKAVSDLAERMSVLKLEPCQHSLLVYKRKSSHFQLPQNMDCPIILVGPGTGIAPFVGFLQHSERLRKTKEADAKKGDAWLFYGCRYDDRDFLYKTELQRLKSAGVLNHLMVSFSREASPPCYVTSKYVHESIRQHAGAIVTAVDSGAKIFVCGDAKHMALDVQQAFVEAFQTSGISETEAKLFVEKLQEEHRYINDVWA